MSNHNFLDGVGGYYEDLLTGTHKQWGNSSNPVELYVRLRDLPPKIAVADRLPKIMIGAERSETVQLYGANGEKEFGFLSEFGGWWDFSNDPLDFEPTHWRAVMW